MYIVVVKTKISKPKAASAKHSARAQTNEEKKQIQQLQAVLDEVTSVPATVHIEEDVSVDCPYCGECFEVHLTTESDRQTMYEDCEVCCRPVAIHVRIEDGEFTIEAYRS